MRQTAMSLLAVMLFASHAFAQDQEKAVSSEGFVRIGEIEQWISVQGEQAMDRAREAPLLSFERTAPYRRWIMTQSDLAFIEMQRRYVGPEPIPQKGEVAEWVQGFAFSVEALGDDILRFDAYATGLDVEIPVVIIQGKQDRVTPFSAAEKFVRDLRAPAKRFVAIDGGHFAVYTNTDEFVSELADSVMPLIE